MATWLMPICEACTRLGPAADGTGYACEAFPDGIPEAIYPEGFDHRQPYPGDNGIRFELDPTQADQLARYDASLIESSSPE
jgi:hypothetical protein